MTDLWVNDTQDTRHDAMVARRNRFEEAMDELRAELGAEPSQEQRERLWFGSDEAAWGEA